MRLTNSSSEFIRWIEGELSRQFASDSIIFLVGFPSLGSGHFSIELLKANQPILLVRQWNQDIGFGYQLGIYNLSNVKISEERKNLSDGDLLIIQELIKADIKVEEPKGIILDGIDFRLKINYQGKITEFGWKLDEQISIKTKILIQRLIELAGIDVK